MNKYNNLLNLLTIKKRNYSSNSHNCTQQIARQKFEEFLIEINKSKDNVTNISYVKWNTGYMSGDTLLFNFKNSSNSYEGQILVRKKSIISDNVLDCDD